MKQSARKNTWKWLKVCASGFLKGQGTGRSQVFASITRRSAPETAPSTIRACWRPPCSPGPLKSTAIKNIGKWPRKPSPIRARGSSPTGHGFTGKTEIPLDRQFSHRLQPRRSEVLHRKHWGQTFEDNLRKGFEFFKKNFFEPTGRPKYYHNRTYPIDSQCCSQSIETLANFSEYDDTSLGLAKDVAKWTIENMQGRDGHFYFMRYPMMTLKVPMIHWRKQLLTRRWPPCFTKQIIMNNNWIIDKSDTVLVTGANGFIGSRVVRTLLSYGFEHVRCLTRPTSNQGNLERLVREFGDGQIEIIQGNLLSRENCATAAKDVSVIYHLAAGIGKSYPDCFLNSVVTTRNLLDAVLEKKSLKRFVNTSSIAVYSNENLPRGGLMDESCEIDDRLLERCEPYTYGKMKQDQLVMDYAEKYGLPYVTVRPSVVFGPGKAAITARIGTDTFGVFLHLGLNNTVPLTYVDNCAEAIVLAGLRRGIEGQVFNIVDDDLPTSREFLKLYKRKVRRFLSLPVPYPIWYFFNCLWENYAVWSEGQLPLAFNKRKCRVYWKGNTYSNKRAKEVLGWKPKVNMNEALERFFDYMNGERKGRR
jgi:nucleoside-diphosphate-sugar epimerase